eukprot:gene10179-7257_t
MDYVFEGQWSDDLRSRVQSWIDHKWAAWGEENPGHKVTDFIQKSLGKATTMAEFSKDLLGLKLGKKKAKKLARKLGELLRSHQAITTAFAAQAAVPTTEAVETAESVPAPSMKKPAMEPFERTKPAAGDHLMGQRQGHGHINVNSSLTSSRDGRDGRQHPNDNVTSQLGKRQLDSEEEPACDQQHNGPVRNVRQRQQQQSSSSADPVTDQLRRTEEHNRVAVELGFRNAQEMLEMASAGRAALMMPPVAHAPYHAPYGGGRGGYHPYPANVDPSPGYGSSTNQALPHPGLAPNALGSAQLSIGYGPMMMTEAVRLANAALLVLGMKQMDYVFEGQWSDDLRSRVQSWIDHKWAAWCEENPGQELTDFIQESLGEAKTMAEFSTDFLALKLGKKKAKKLARELGELLRSSGTDNRGSEDSRTIVMEPAMEPVERTKPAPGDHLMGQRQGHVNVDSSLTSSRDNRDRRHLQQHVQHHAQDDPQGSDHLYSQLGKRQMDNEEEPVRDQQHNGPVRGRNVRPREQQQQQLSSGEGNATINDQLCLMEERHNRVAVELGFRNAQEMLEMASAGRAALMMPPVTAPYHAPYGGGRGGYHPYPGYVSRSHGYDSSTNQTPPHPGSAPNALGSAQLSIGYGPMMTAEAVVLANAPYRNNDVLVGALMSPAHSARQPAASSAKCSGLIVAAV